MLFYYLFQRWLIFCIFFNYFIQSCFICRPLDSIVPEDAGIEPKTVVTLVLAGRRSNYSARSYLNSYTKVYIQMNVILSRNIKFFSYIIRAWDLLCIHHICRLPVEDSKLIAAASILLTADVLTLEDIIAAAADVADILAVYCLLAVAMASVLLN